MPAPKQRALLGSCSCTRTNRCRRSGSSTSCGRDAAADCARVAPQPRPRAAAAARPGGLGARPVRLRAARRGGRARPRRVRAAGRGGTAGRAARAGRKLRSALALWRGPPSWSSPPNRSHSTRSRGSTSSGSHPRGQDRRRARPRRARGPGAGARVPGAAVSASGAVLGAADAGPLPRAAGRQRRWRRTVMHIGRSSTSSASSRALGCATSSGPSSSRTRRSTIASTGRA